MELQRLTSCKIQSIKIPVKNIVHSKFFNLIRVLNIDVFANRLKLSTYKYIAGKKGKTKVGRSGKSETGKTKGDRKMLEKPRRDRPTKGRWQRHKRKVFDNKHKKNQSQVWMMKGDHRISKDSKKDELL